MVKMIYKLTRNHGGGYDEFHAKIIRASNEKEAREIANQMTGDEGQLWTDKSLVTCERILCSGKSCELLGYYQAG